MTHATRIGPWTGVATLALVTALVGPAAGQRKVDVTATHFYVAILEIPASTAATFETTGCVWPADPVFHLLTIDGVQVAYDDNGGGGVNSRIVVAPFWQPRLVALVMRSKSNPTFGTCDVRLDGAVLDAAMPVGGVRLGASQVTFAAGDRLHTQHVPGGSVMPSLVKFSPSLTTVTGIALGNFIGGSSRLTLLGNESHFMVGTPVVRVHGAAPTMPRGGGARLLSNDHLNDSDEDGIGDDLEDALETFKDCVAPHCPYNAATSKDSDRDGLEDGEEVFGLPASTAAAEVPLARWGASPLRKDIFLQVSYLTELGVPPGVQPVPLGMNPFEWLRANPNLPTGFYKQTLEDWVADVREPFTPATANDHAKNPDDSSGVALHIDLGVPPLNPAVEAEFGAYSMAASRAIVGDLVVNVNAPVGGYVFVRINGSPWEWINAAGWTVEEIATAIGQKAEDTGEPVFVQSVHCQGTPCERATVAIRTAVPGQQFTHQILLLPDAPGAVTVADREWTDSLLNRYREADTLDAARRGRFRLSIATALGLGGQAPIGFPASVIGVGHAQVGAPPTQVAHELGHSLRLEHGGHEDWGTHTADCVPHYRSLMSYAPTEYRFADTDGLPALNPARAIEGAPFGGSFPYSIFYNPPHPILPFGTTYLGHRPGTSSST